MHTAFYKSIGPAREVLRLGELPDPQPAPGEVRVRLRWSGVNPSDVKTRAGSRGAPAFPRVIPHSDGMGVIDAVGESVSDANLTRSMSRKACSPDHAACEGFFGRLKNELFYPQDWKSITVEQFIEVVDSYIRWYNDKRIKISLGSLSPVEYRKSLGLAT